VSGSLFSASGDLTSKSPEWLAVPEIDHSLARCPRSLGDRFGARRRCCDRSTMVHSKVGSDEAVSVRSAMRPAPKELRPHRNQIRASLSVCLTKAPVGLMVAPALTNPTRYTRRSQLKLSPESWLLAAGQSHVTGGSTLTSADEQHARPAASRIQHLTIPGRAKAACDKFAGPILLMVVPV